MLPDATYYSSAEVADVRPKYRAYLEQILTLIGWPEPAARADEIVAFETRVAAESTPLEQLVDPAQSHTMRSAYANCERLTPGFDWAAYFAGAGIAPPKRDGDRRSAGFRAESLRCSRKADLGMLRARQAFAAADYNAALLSSDLYSAKVGFRTNVLNTPSLAARSRKDGGERLVEAVTPDVLGAIYVERFVPTEVNARAKANGRGAARCAGCALRNGRLVEPGVENRGSAQGRRDANSRRLSRSVRRLCRDLKSERERTLRRRPRCRGL